MVLIPGSGLFYLFYSYEMGSPGDNPEALKWRFHSSATCIDSLPRDSFRCVPRIPNKLSNSVIELRQKLCLNYTQIADQLASSLLEERRLELTAPYSDYKKSKAEAGRYWCLYPIYMLNALASDRSA